MDLEDLEHNRLNNSNLEFPNNNNPELLHNSNNLEFPNNSNLELYNNNNNPECLSNNPE